MPRIRCCTDLSVNIVYIVARAFIPYCTAEVGSRGQLSPTVWPHNLTTGFWPPSATVVSVPAEGNGDLQTLICVLADRPRRCPTLLNTVLWQSWMAAYPGYSLQMKMLFSGWPIMVHDTQSCIWEDLMKNDSSPISNASLCRCSFH